MRSLEQKEKKQTKHAQKNRILGMMMKKTSGSPQRLSTPYLFMVGTVYKVNYIIFKSFFIRLSSSIDFYISRLQKTQAHN